MLFFRICAMVAGIILIAPFARSGDMDSPADPTDTGSAMYTLTDIYNRLDTGTATAKRTGAFTEPTDGPGTATGRTLDEIMAIAPAKDDTDGASASHVLSGKTFWGLTAAGWGTQTGSIETRMLSSGTTTVSAGYYEATDLASVDAALVAANIKSGVTIFGIAGSVISGTSTTVPKTGQITSYSVTTGEDGDLQKGTAWPSPRFIDNNNGAVTDNLTGLIWLKNANAGGTKTWENALSYCNNLASDSAGLTDGSAAGNWRLPNVRELQTIIHYGVYNPALPNTEGTGQWTSGNPFTNVQSNYYWTSTSNSSYTNYAFALHLISGFVWDKVKATETLYVWPVRGGE